MAHLRTWWINLLFFPNAGKKPRNCKYTNVDVRDYTKAAVLFEVWKCYRNAWVSPTPNDLRMVEISISMLFCWTNGNLWNFTRVNIKYIDVPVPLGGIICPRLCPFPSLRIAQHQISRPCSKTTTLTFNLKAGTGGFLCCCCTQGAEQSLHNHSTQAPGWKPWIPFGN